MQPNNKAGSIPINVPHERKTIRGGGGKNKLNTPRIMQNWSDMEQILL